MHDHDKVGAEGRCLSSKSIRHRWRKADILPISWNQYINNEEVGEASIPEWKKVVVSKEISNELCTLMAGIKLKANESSIDTTTSTVGNIFKDTFVTDGDFSSDDFNQQS